MLVPHVGAVVLWVSDELLEDETYGLQGYIQERVSEGKTLLEEEAFVSGSGTGRPRGLLTALNAEAAQPNRYTTQVAANPLRQRHHPNSVHHAGTVQAQRCLHSWHQRNSDRALAAG